MFPDDIGDFAVWDDQLDRARDRQAERSEESRAQDRAKRAPVTTNVGVWAENPDRYDYPGIDTPSENPNVLPKDLKHQYPARTTSKVQDKAPTDPVERTERDYQRERLGSMDLSLSPGEAFEGRHVESQASSNVGGFMFNVHEGQPVETDRVDQEQKPPESALKRHSETTDTGDIYNFDDWTVSRGRTYLNEKVYDEGREDLRSLRDKLSPGEPVELDKGEYQTFQRVVREGAEDELDTLQGMEANIYGDAEDQRKIARSVRQDIVNNPPKY